MIFGKILIRFSSYCFVLIFINFSFDFTFLSHTLLIINVFSMMLLLSLILILSLFFAVGVANLDFTFILFVKTNFVLLSLMFENITSSIFVRSEIVL